MKQFLFIFLCSLSGISTVLAHPADIGAPIGTRSGAIKLATAINLAGRQRTLTQRMAKAYMLKGMGEDVAAAKRQMDLTVSSFEESLRLLKAFPSNSACQERLARQEALWNTYKAQLTGDVKEQDIASVLASSDVILASCEELVAALKQLATTSSNMKAYGNGQSLADMIDISGRQRTYSHRLAAYYAAYLWDKAHPEAYLAEVTRMHTKIENAMVVLYTCTCNTQGLMDELSFAVGIWKPIRDDLNGLSMQQVRAGAVSEAANTLLQQMDIVTKMYEDLLAL